MDSQRRQTETAMMESFIEDMKFSGVDVPELTKARIDSLVASGPARATPDSVGLKFTVPAGDAAAEAEEAECLKAAGDYLTEFVADGGCPNCGRRHCFTWGFAHGEGYCVTCKYPGRAVHDIENVGVISNLILWYHPSLLQARETPTT